MESKHIKVNELLEHFEDLFEEFSSIDVPKIKGIFFSEPDYYAENFKQGRLMGYTDVINFAKEKRNDIVLSPEILEENGFEKYGGEGESWTTMWTSIGPDGEGDIEIVFKDEGEISVKIDAAGSYCSGTYISTMHIKTVNQLNTLFELLGIKKNINDRQKGS